MDRKAKLRAHFRLTRPFTHLPVMLGVLSGAAAGFGSARYVEPYAGGTWKHIGSVMVGAICGVFLNCGSNAINQIYDLDIDRINKPYRPLCTGELTIPEAWTATKLYYVVALVPTWFLTIDPPPECSRVLRILQSHQFTSIMVLAALTTLAYSVPAFGRTKRFTYGALLSIAFARGFCLRLVGWSAVASVFNVEACYLGFVFGLFIFGAAVTKDFADIPGDKEYGCLTLPIEFGVKDAARMITPAFVVPWVFLPIGAFLSDPWTPGQSILTGNAAVLCSLGVLLSTYGTYIVSLILKNPTAMANIENHPSWVHMYLMMMIAQMGLVLAYLVVAR